MLFSNPGGRSGPSLRSLGLLDTASRPSLAPSWQSIAAHPTASLSLSLGASGPSRPVSSPISRPARAGVSENMLSSRAARRLSRVCCIWAGQDLSQIKVVYARG